MATAAKFGAIEGLGETSEDIFTARHFSPREIADLWSLSVDCIRKIFENEPGVLVIGNSEPRRFKRSYTTLRIPQAVVERVHRRLSKV